MGILEFIKKKAIEIEVKQNNIFTYPVEKQKKYVESFPEPRDLIERSFFQYKCQMKLYGQPLVFILNACALPLLLVFLIKNDHKTSLKADKRDAVFFLDGKPQNILPNEIKKLYKHIEFIKEKKIMLLNEDKKYLLRVWKRFPFSYFFSLKCLLKIKYYRYEIETHKPDAIIVCNEYSFTSSLLTDYCHKNGIKHINVMHGEKVYFMMDSFFEFDQCYVWHEQYKNLFMSLRASKEQFYFSVPDSLCFKTMDLIPVKLDYTYYLGNETGISLKKIIGNLEKLASTGSIVAVRPHPRYTDMDELRSYVSGVLIEDCKTVSIEESILRTKHVVSLFSTVLNQAFNNGVDIVIDDLSNPCSFNKLVELQYIMISLKHSLLSDVLSHEE